MSRTPSLARALGSSSRTVLSPLQLSKRTLIGDRRPTSGDVSTTSVDPRVLNGLPSFLPKANVDRVCEWQAGLWTRLQDEIRNNPSLLEVKQKWDRTGLDMTYLLSQSAKDPQMTIAFNYASLLLNNSYFLEGINGDSTLQEIPADYKELEEKVQAYAEGMVGGGWLWIVRYGDSNKAVDVFPSFAGGTLLVTNRAQRGREDLPVFGTPKTSGQGLNADGQPADEPVQEINVQPRLRATQRPMARSSTDRPIPLAVLNLFEHAYIGEKYGVWSRGEYARDWFKALNWNTVQKRSAHTG
ncbi:hypothetical protein DB88DRAFT_492420 [Papiliotrema laurentii]|uniref:Manganese/iron superoxide dismutase C-terminal domain-containing protein n=1 Tax=Papiliotrema laurentii TaxID=5418 RepID=A0AAD9D0H4_PAPLA|nr:hypothetical protein DB88DRAFT_492420 [Papiliotrema laurentii]